MDYWSCKRRGVPIGSGITEAACKTLFAQRIKCSGMTWGLEGGQCVLELRVLLRSGVWSAAFAKHLESQPLPTPDTTASHSLRRTKAKKAA